MYEEIDLLEGLPGILKRTAKNRQDSFERLFVKAYSVFDNGSMYLVVNTGGSGQVYNNVLYEDLEFSEDGTILFEAYESKYEMRRLEKEDGIRFTLPETPLSPDILEKMIMVDSSTESGAEQTVQALSDPNTGQVVALVYEISKVGTFFRIDGEWGYPDEEMAKNLDGMVSTLIKPGEARDLVERWDSNPKMSVEDLEEYSAEESE